MIDYRQSETQQIFINDSEWFTGNIINYTIDDCDECGKKIRVINHL